jgi:hypothetical protein
MSVQEAAVIAGRFVSINWQVPWYIILNTAVRLHVLLLRFICACERNDTL